MTDCWTNPTAIGCSDVAQTGLQRAQEERAARLKAAAEAQKAQALPIGTLTPSTTPATTCPDVANAQTTQQALDNATKGTNKDAVHGALADAGLAQFSATAAKKSVLDDTDRLVIGMAADKVCSSEKGCTEERRQEITTQMTQMEEAKKEGKPLPKFDKPAPSATGTRQESEERKIARQRGEATKEARKLPEGADRDEAILKAQGYEATSNPSFVRRDGQDYDKNGLIALEHRRDQQEAIDAAKKPAATRPAEDKKEVSAKKFGTMVAGDKNGTQAAKGQNRAMAARTAQVQSQAEANKPATQAAKKDEKPKTTAELKERFDASRAKVEELRQSAPKVENDPYGVKRELAIKNSPEGKAAEAARKEFRTAKDAENAQTEKDTIAKVGTDEEQAKKDGKKVEITLDQTPRSYDGDDKTQIADRVKREEQVKRMAAELKSGKKLEDGTYQLPKGVELTQAEIDGAKDAGELEDKISSKLDVKADAEYLAREAQAEKEYAARQKSNPTAPKADVPAPKGNGTDPVAGTSATKTAAPASLTATPAKASDDPNQQGPVATSEELSANARAQLSPKEQVALDKAHVDDAKAEAATTKPEGKKGKGFEDMDFNELIKMKFAMDMFGGGNNGGGNGGGMGSNPVGMLLAARLLGIDLKELGLAGGNAQKPGMDNDARYGTNAPSAFQRGGIISALNLDGYKDSKEYKQTQYDNARDDAARYTDEAKNGKAGWFTKTFFGRTDEDVQEAAAKKRDAALEKAASIDLALHPVTADTNA